MTALLSLWLNEVLTPFLFADESGQLVNMAGALIPEGYELDDTFPDRPWVCPVRSCRSACKFRKSLGYHFMVSSMPFRCRTRLNLTTITLS